MSDKNKDSILNKLRQKTPPFPDVRKPEKYLEMVPVNETDTEKLWLQFAREAEKLSSQVYVCNGYDSAEKKLYEFIEGEKGIYCWKEDNLPLKNLPESVILLNDKNIRHTSEVKIGISGAVAAIAATGSIVISSGQGRFRITSLLPDIHIVLLEKDQIYATFENWLAFQRQNGMHDLLDPSNIVLISGPSRTADIAMELVLGMHGPQELHIIVF